MGRRHLIREAGGRQYLDAVGPIAVEISMVNNATHALGDAPIEDEYIQQMNDLAHAIDRIFNGDKHGEDRSTGFVLLVFPFGDKEGRCNYISNGARREDIVVMMKEQIKRFEGQPELRGTA